jgi:hypothetical protein
MRLSSPANLLNHRARGMNSEEFVAGDERRLEASAVRCKRYKLSLEVFSGAPESNDALIR